MKINPVYGQWRREDTRCIVMPWRAPCGGLEYIHHISASCRSGEKGTDAMSYNKATLSVWDINIGTWYTW
jgi:hypothetical protein